MVSHVGSLEKHRKGFFDFFPAPKFLLISTEGLSISDTGIQFIRFNKGNIKGGYSLLASADVSIPQGLVSSGSIENKESLIKSLAELKSRFRIHFTHATLPEEKAYVYTTELDKMPFKDLHDAVAFTIEENAPVTLKDSTFYFDVIGDVTDKKSIKVAVSVVPTAVVDSYVEVLESAGITPISFDIESQAMARALVPKNDPRTHLIINLGENKTGLYVAEDGVVQFSSTLPMGVGAETALSLKSEMKRLFAFWNTRISKDGIPEKRIERILFAGSGAKNEAYISTLMNGVEIEYAIGNVWINAFSFDEYVPDVPFEDSLGLASAVGAALPVNEVTYI